MGNILSYFLSCFDNDNEIIEGLLIDTDSNLSDQIGEMFQFLNDFENEEVFDSADEEEFQILADEGEFQNYDEGELLIFGQFPIQDDNEEYPIVQGQEEFPIIWDDDQQLWDDEFPLIEVPPKRQQG